LRACSAKVAYMPWPLPELHGGGGHGGGGGGSAAAAAMASNPIARSELSHLRKLFPQKFEAARRCPQVTLSIRTCLHLALAFGFWHLVLASKNAQLR